jgi:hypothetical protein
MNRASGETFRQLSIVEHSWTFVTQAEESVMGQCVVEADQAKPWSGFGYVTCVTIGGGTRDLRPGGLAQDLE